MIVKPRGHSLWLVKLPGGPAWLTPDLGDAIDHITVIWRRGIYDKYKPTKGQVVVDAGAHIGIYTVRVSKEVGNNGTILAIEPHPTNFECLQKSLGLNKCENVIPVNAAMASSCGEITLWLSDQSVGHSIKLRRSNSSLSVRSVTLDQLMEDFELTTIHLLKIDVEGATLDVLKGAEKTLRVHKPKIIAEIAHYPTEKEEVVHFLSDLEYNFSTEDEILYAEPRYNSF
jgi:FkbM family methyltransferase